MARWRSADLFPARLAVFREADWPPVPGECLGHYSCRGNGYDGPCVSLDGPCGWRFYAECPPGFVPRWRRRDAVARWREARMAYLGEDHPSWLGEFCASLADDG